MRKKKIALNELLNLIPEEYLENLSEQTGVDYQVKKLTGKLVFKLLLYGLSSQKELSWRILETIFSSYKFKNYAQIPPDSLADHSSLATRISNIKIDFFKSIHQSLKKEILLRFDTPRIGGYKVVRFDSTLVSIAGTLLKKVTAMHHGVNNKYRKIGDSVDLKFTIGFDGLSPVIADVFGQQSYMSWEIALKEVIENHDFKPNDLAVFDRGLNKRDTFYEFTDKSLIFVTRMKTQRKTVKHQLVRNVTNIPVEKPLETDKLWIDKDQEVILFGRKSKKSKHSYRLIQARNKENGTRYFFLTNEMDLSVEQILLIYKYRWDIEVFFKFLKQEFGFKHFLSRNQNGNEVVLYMTLITFSLIYLYYKLNEFESFKLAKMQFVNELDFEIMKVIVELCNGDPQLLHLLNPFKVLDTSGLAP